jgi:hypothetical protein
MIDSTHRWQKLMGYSLIKFDDLPDGAVLGEAPPGGA